MTEHIRLYLVEDDPMVVHFVRTALQERPTWSLVGHSETLTHARVTVPVAQPDVVLVDLGLPDGQGADLLAIFKDETPASELLVFTSADDEQNIRHAIQSGAAGYVLKGCDQDTFLQAIEQIHSGGTPLTPQVARILLTQWRSESKPEPKAPPKPTFSHVTPLSQREIEVLRLVAEGFANKRIARELQLSETTVGSHLKNAYGKLTVHSRTQAVRAAQHIGIL